MKLMENGLSVLIAACMLCISVLFFVEVHVSNIDLIPSKQLLFKSISNSKQVVLDDKKLKTRSLICPIYTDKEQIPSNKQVLNKNLAQSNMHDKKLPSLTQEESPETLKEGSVVSSVFVYIGIIVFIILVLTNIFIVPRKRRRDRMQLQAHIEDRTEALIKSNQELARLNVELKEAKQKAEQAIHVKDRFFSILAHDLKGPFNVIIGFSDLLVNNWEQFSKKKLQLIFDEMLSTSENSFNLLNDLLEWSKSQAGYPQMNLAILNLEAIDADIIGTYKALLSQKDIAIRHQVHENFELYADKAVVSTVMRNLIGNAIKFSYPQSEILVKTFNTSDHSFIQVQDSGMGIAPDIIEHLFKLDHTTTTLGTNNEKGSGLGLIICNELIEQARGSITVESEKGKGSTFTIKLPRKGD